MLIGFCAISKLYANDTITFVDSRKIQDISSSLLIFEDKSGIMSFDDIVSKPFEKTNKQIPNLGISKSTFWIKMCISNYSNSNSLILNLSLPTLDFVEFYVPDENNNYKNTTMGEHLHFSQRKYEDPDYIFDLSLISGKSKIYYMKVHSKEGIQLPVNIGSEEVILDQVKNKGIISGLYFGIMLVIIFYNLFIYFSVRDKNYLYYVVYVLFTFITQTSLQGYTFQFLWPNQPIFASYILFIAPSITGVTGIIFMKVFLEVKSFSPILNKLVYVLCLPYFISICCLFFGNYNLSQVILELNSMVISIFMLVTPIIILRKGFKPAKFFLIAWSMFLIGIFIYILKDMEVLPFNNFTRYTMQIGTATEVILLSFALADRINILKKEKEESQATALLALQENEKLITEQNIILEQKVHERTIKLEATNEELNVTLSDLKDTQAQLVNAEKMASLGQLTAGIAHEINNPINFVSANVKPLKMDIEDVLSLVKKYETLTPDKITKDDFEEIEKFRKEIDIDYLKKEMEFLLLGIEDGAKRTAEIVSGLKNFSRLDEGDVKEVNINDGIKSTLILLNSAVPPNTKIITRLSEIPIIECLPGKLNQVFMNLFSNALYAIKQKNSADENSLTISTYISEENVIVEIIDTGIGMTPEVRAKIFDPFFTTKDVGEGTGLGMSIVFNIIESHGAKILVESEYGVGTKILLILNKKINFIPVI